MLTADGMNVVIEMIFLASLNYGYLDIIPWECISNYWLYFYNYYDYDDTPLRTKRQC